VERRFEGFLGIPGLASSRLSVGAAADGSDTPRSGDKPPLGTLWDWGARVGFTASTAGGGLRIHGGVSRRTRFPALRELYSGALGRFVPNPDLRPELLTGGELGLTWASENGQLQVVGFHQRLTDGIVRSSVEVDGQRRFKRVNQDEVRSTGLELLGSAALGAVTLHGDMTLQDVTGLTDSGEEIDLEYEPTILGRLGLASPLPLELVGSADLRFTGEQFCENPEVGGLQSFDSDPDVGVALRRGFTLGGRTLDRLEALVAVDNAGDAAVYDQCGLPQPGRTFRIQLRLW
jgi:iron complex outermembrane receptor protein